jgi:hypothetical protein
MGAALQSAGALRTVSLAIAFALLAEFLLEHARLPQRGAVRLLLALFAVGLAIALTALAELVLYSLPCWCPGVAACATLTSPLG